ncbi:SLC13 family permease [Modestobacter lacusdianchii]
MWKWVGAGACVALVSGVLSPDEAGHVLVRIAPILVFLVAVTVLAELADAAGVFSTAADHVARAGRGSTGALFVLVAGLATAVTAVLSLDTTAVLLTPVVLTMSRRLGLPPVPFAMLIVWLANTASLLLPVSNLTNLLAVDRLDAGTSFVGLMALPAVAVAAASVLVVGIRYRRQLRGRYPVPVPKPVDDPVLLRFAVAICTVAGALFAVGQPLGIPVAATASVGAGALVAVFAVRARRALGGHLVPWRLTITTVGLFLIVQAALGLGLDDVLTDVAGAGDGPADLLRLTVVAALSSNALNNLPAYLALEPVASPSSLRTAALLIGTNAGPLLLPWASLATLLWADRCRAAGVSIRFREFFGLGLLGVPVVLLVGVLALMVAGR